MKKISGKDTNSLIILLGNFIEGKRQLLRYFMIDSLENVDKQIILERMVENTIEDIVIFNNLRSLAGEPMDTSLTVEYQERLKKEILKKLMN